MSRPGGRPDPRWLAAVALALYPGLAAAQGWAALAEDPLRLLLVPCALSASLATAVLAESDTAPEPRTPGRVWLLPVLMGALAVGLVLLLLS